MNHLSFKINVLGQSKSLIVRIYEKGCLIFFELTLKFRAFKVLITRNK